MSEGGKLGKSDSDQIGKEVNNSSGQVGKESGKLGSDQVGEEVNNSSDQVNQLLSSDAKTPIKVEEPIKPRKLESLDINDSIKLKFELSAERLGTAILSSETIEELFSVLYKNLREVLKLQDSYIIVNFENTDLPYLDIALQGTIRFYEKYGNEGSNNIGINNTKGLSTIVNSRFAQSNKTTGMVDTTKKTILVLDDGRKVGEINVLFKYLPDEHIQIQGMVKNVITETILKAAEKFAQLCRQQELKYDMWRDPLTGTFTKKYLDKKGNEMFERLGQGKGILNSLFVDLNHFKSINDRFGHENGDKALKETAHILKDIVDKINSDIRGEDKAFLSRNGGDEFVIIVPELSEGQIKKYIKEILRFTREHTYLSENGEYAQSVTCSIGFSRTTRNPDVSYDNFRSLLKNSDAAMYKAKTDEYRLTGACVTDLNGTLLSTKENIVCFEIIYSELDKQYTELLTKRELHVSSLLENFFNNRNTTKEKFINYIGKLLKERTIISSDLIIIIKYLRIKDKLSKISLDDIALLFESPIIEIK